MIQTKTTQEQLAFLEDTTIWLKANIETPDAINLLSEVCGAIEKTLETNGDATQKTSQIPMIPKMTFNSSRNPIELKEYVSNIPKRKVN